MVLSPRICYSLAGLSLLAAVGCASIALAPCEGDVCYTAEPLPPEYVVGATLTLPGPGYLHNGPIVVHLLSSDAAAKFCTRHVGVFAFACSGWRPGGDMGFEIREGDIVLPAGASCVVYVPPVRWLVEHELRHCREGNWH